MIDTLQMLVHNLCEDRGWQAGQHPASVQEEGLKAVSQRRRMRLARQAAATWRGAVKRAAESRERERRTLEALAKVHVGIRATPFRLHWPPDVPQEQPVSPLIFCHSLSVV